MFWMVAWRSLAEAVKPLHQATLLAGRGVLVHHTFAYGLVELTNRAERSFTGVCALAFAQGNTGGLDVRARTVTNQTIAEPLALVAANALEC